MTINDLYFRAQILDAVPTKGLPGSALAELMLLRTRTARPVADYFKTMQEAVEKLRDDEKFAALKEEDAEGCEELRKELEEAEAKMWQDAATEDRYKAVGVLSEAAFAAICDVAMAQGAVTMTNMEGKKVEIPAEAFLADLAAIIDADSRQKK